ncbi:helix-turn-helix domain-containing protein [Diaphorobacter ruginosibacter]|uniref:Helix-turn-helix domain-containing protein n=1 Tax=Diaphorobacter ruginosibacter TaxID=1715720 RepID=A0A7G9RKV9_9BURK|nr:helix-turn-helix domain-containing protein [Diaphorobacter ruginosibacter]QNN56234.1 helix-turn-helix domain-containing protein [Diaphorobacter ruginosibacter]
MPTADDSPPAPPSSKGPIVTAVVRALALLDAFGEHDAQLSLAQLAQRTQLAKPTALRLARTLSSAGYLVALPEGAWRLGPAVALLGARYQRAFDLRNVIEPALHALAHESGHSASFFALEHGRRVRLLRVRGADGFVSPTRVGEPLPLDRGAAGQVILAFTGNEGALMEDIRQRGYHATVGEANALAASIAAPVFAARGAVIGALSLAVAASDGASAELLRHAKSIMDAADRLSRTLAAARYADQETIVQRSHWHP